MKFKYCEHLKINNLLGNVNMQDEHIFKLALFTSIIGIMGMMFFGDDVFCRGDNAQGD